MTIERRGSQQIPLLEAGGLSAFGDAQAGSDK